MNTKFPIRNAVLLVACAVALAACQQERNNNASGAAVRDVPAAAKSSMSESRSATVPANDPSLPSQGTSAATPNAAVATTSGPTTASGPGSSTDAAQTTLTVQERDRALPLEGQTNSYSSDAFAKRGDTNIEHSQQGPRGSEPAATPNSYTPSKESK